MTDEQLVEVPEELREFIPKDETVVETQPDAEAHKVEKPIEEPVVDTKEPEIQEGATAQPAVPYSRFKQMVDQKNLLKAELEAAKAQQPIQQVQPTPPLFQPTQPPAPVDISEQIAKMADEAVKKRLGLDGLDESDFNILAITEPAKFTKYVKELAKEEISREADYKEFQKTYATNIEFHTKMNTPDFPVLFQFSKNELMDKPKREADKIAESYERIVAYRGSKDDMDAVEKFLGECRAKMSGIKPEETIATTPQKESALDKADALPRATKLGGAKTGSMTWQQVEQLIRDGKADQIPQDMLAMIDPKLLE